MPHIALKDAWRALMLHNARETMLAKLWRDGYRTVTGQGHGVTNYTFVEFLQPFGASSKRVFVCPRIKLTLTENQTPFWLISIITITTTPPLGLPFIHVSRRRWGHWDWGITKNGECIKEKLTYNAIPQTTTLQCLTSMDFTSCYIWEEDPLVLVGHDYHSLF